MSELNIPESWAETNLEVVIGQTIGGANIKSTEYSESGVRVVLKTDVQPLGQVTTSDRFVSPDVVKKKYSSRLTYQDNVLICMRDLSQKANILGLISLVGFENEESLVSQGITIARNVLPDVNKTFLCYFSNSPIYRAYIQNKKRGSTQVHLGNDDIAGVQFPLPPKQEQERIVQKIESCFSKIEEAEQNLNKVEILLEKYRESLLAKAFRGELIPQNPADEPASVLLAKIREERAQNQKGKKKEQEFSPISDEEKPFDIPEGWEAIKLGELAAFIDYRGKTPKKIDSGIKLITAKNVRMGYIKNDPEEFISEKDYVGWMTRGFPGTNDLLITTEAPMGNVAITPIGFRFALAQRIINLKINENVNAKFLMYLIMFKDFQRHLDKLGTGATVKGIKASVLKNIYIYFPSMKTQIRIVDSLDKSFALIEVIRRNVVKNKTHLNQFKEALLIKAFEGRLVEQIESEGTGYELLQKILKQKEQEISVKESTKKRVAKKVSKKKTTKK